MKIISVTLAAAIATAALGLPAIACAQTMPGPDAHQPMPDHARQHGDMGPGGMHQDNTQGDMHQGDSRAGDMHHDDMRGGDMRGGDMHHDGMGHGHGGHRHCRTSWRHHHRVRMCR